MMIEVLSLGLPAKNLEYLLDQEMAELLSEIRIGTQQYLGRRECRAAVLSGCLESQT
jgi:hypothetical protein